MSLVNSAVDFSNIVKPTRRIRCPKQVNNVKEEEKKKGLVLPLTLARTSPASYPMARVFLLFLISIS